MMLKNISKFITSNRRKKNNNVFVKRKNGNN